MRSGRQRYNGLQTFLKDGCYFLSLCSIAEDSSGKKVDIVEAYNMVLDSKWATEDAYILNPTAILHWLTSRHWTLVKSTSLPSSVPDNMYTVAKWVNGNVTHFRRRDVDTLRSSVTVAKGKVKEWYLFTEE